MSTLTTAAAALLVLLSFTSLPPRCDAFSSHSTPSQRCRIAVNSHLSVARFDQVTVTRYGGLPSYFGGCRNGNGSIGAFCRPRAGPSTALSAAAAGRGGGGALVPSSLVNEDSFRSVPADSVLSAIQSSSDASGRIVASDLSASAGISLSQARRDLQTLATLTGAGMAVTDGGELVYAFPYDLRGALRRKSARYRARALAKRAWPGLFYGVRLGFGVMMIVSLVTIFASLAALSAAAEAGAAQDDDDRRRGRGPVGRGGVYGDSGGYYGGRRGGGVHLHFGPSLFNSWFGPSPFDMFYYGRGDYGYYGRRRRPPLYGAYTVNPWGGSPAVQRRDDIMGRTTELVNEEPDMSFLEAFYSYVFGDGDPNRDVDMRLLSAAATVIRSNGGAVTSEQLAPFLLDPPPADVVQTDEYDDGIVRLVDESYVLPIVTKLGGEPTVTDDGDIVYVFPEMATTTTTEASMAEPSASDPDLSWLLQRTRDEVEDAAAARTVSYEAAVKEEELEFSLAGSGQRVAAAALGVVNLGGALALGRALANPKLSGAKLVGTLGIVQRTYPLILSYAVLYNAIPLVRYVRLKRRNKRILQRNSDRKRWAARLRSAAGDAKGSIGRKLKAARGMTQRIRGVDEEKIVFDTTEDEVKRRKRTQQQALEEFDDLLFDED